MNRRTGTLEAEVARYMARATRIGECLVGPWRAYGSVRYEAGLKQMSAHRASYIVNNGAIPQGLVVRHACDNPPCIEPLHLMVGTHQDNEDDKWSRGRGAFGLAAGRATVPPEDIRAAVREYLSGGKSQAEMAHSLGVGATTFGRWVRAESRIDVGLPGVVVGSGSRIATGIKPCGTRAGWFRHRRDSEPICEPCRQANIVYFRAYRAARRQQLVPSA